jgi:hypothetical protein
MTEQIGQAQAPWTEEEAAAFAQKLVAFQGALPPRERDAFTAIMATAADRDGSGGDDARGYVVEEFVIAFAVAAFAEAGGFKAIDPFAHKELLH